MAAEVTVCQFIQAAKCRDLMQRVWEQQPTISAVFPYPG
jgi:hypothetical protein